MIRHALLCFVWLIGCAPTDVVVAVRPSGPTCTSDDDCHGDDDYCARDSCDQDVPGHCQRRPTLCDAVAGPVCGCDGITYWNDCLRRHYGMNAAAGGECLEDVLGCSGPRTCPHGASCARVSASGKCSSDAAGACWQLPPSCPPPDGQRFARCGDTTSCVSACEAFRSEEPHQSLPSSTCP